MLKYTLLFFTLAAFLSCKKEKPAPASLLYGKWYYTADTVRWYTNGVLDSTTQNPLLTFKHIDYLQLNDNNTCSTFYNGEIINFNYYIRSTDSLTFAYRGVADDYEEVRIDSLTENKMKLIYLPYPNVISPAVTEYVETTCFSK